MATVRISALLFSGMWRLVVSQNEAKVLNRRSNKLHGVTFHQTGNKFRTPVIVYICPGASIEISVVLLQFASCIINQNSSFITNFSYRWHGTKPCSKRYCYAAAIPEGSHTQKRRSTTLYIATDFKVGPVNCVERKNAYRQPA